MRWRSSRTRWSSRASLWKGAWLEIGDLLEVDIRSAGEVYKINLQIVGALEYFPRWYPEDEGALFLGNLDYLFEQAQLELAHRV